MALMLIEWIASKILNKKVYQISDTISSISSGMTNNIKSILNLSIVIISYHGCLGKLQFSNFHLGGLCFRISRN